MAEAGVVGLVLALYCDTWSSSLDAWTPSFAKDLSRMPAILVEMLVGSGTGAADDVQRAICSTQTVDVYIALLLVQVCFPWLYVGKRNVLLFEQKFVQQTQITTCVA